MLKYSLGENIEAFTTDRTVGRNIPGVIYPHQVHTDRIFAMTSDLFALSERERKDALEGIDAIMTDRAGVCIGVSTADCIPVLLYDGAHHAACAIHAGWRGTVSRIVEKAVQAMVQTYGSKPCDLQAQIGPGISLDSFEVGDDVYDTFAQAGFDMVAISQKRAKWHIDLPACNKLQLMAMGVKPERISVSDICTYKSHDTFFSARRLGINSGRIFTAILMKP